jgi:hypothetical protein
VGLLDRLGRRGLKQIAVALQRLFVGVWRLVLLVTIIGSGCWLRPGLLPASVSPSRKPIRLSLCSAFTANLAGAGLHRALRRYVDRPGSKPTDSERMFSFRQSLLTSASVACKKHALPVQAGQ